MIQEIFSSAYTYIITVVVMFLIFLILYIKQSMKLNKLMKKYDKFMKGKNAENLDGAIRESFKQIEKINVEHQKTMMLYIYFFNMFKTLSYCSIKILCIFYFHKLNYAYYSSCGKQDVKKPWGFTLNPDNREPQR